jgi:hypothetical protein
MGHAIPPPSSVRGGLDEGHHQLASAQGDLLDGLLEPLDRVPSIGRVHPGAGGIPRLGKTIILHREVALDLGIVMAGAHVQVEGSIELAYLVKEGWGCLPVMVLAAEKVQSLSPCCPEGGLLGCRQEVGSHKGTRDLGNDGVAVGAQSSHALGYPISQRVNAGLSRPRLPITAGEPLGVIPSSPTW